MRKIFILLFLLSVTSITMMAQSQQEFVKEEQEKIYQFFEQHIPWKTTNDSSMIYAFAFKAVVEKDPSGKIRLVSLTANNPAAYTIYPHYKFLETVNYRLFMEGRKRAEFIFPIVLDIWNSKLSNSSTSYNHYHSDIMALFFYSSGSGFAAIQDRIYFRPYLLKMDKTIIE